MIKKSKQIPKYESITLRRYEDDSKVSPICYLRVNKFNIIKNLIHVNLVLDFSKEDIKATIGVIIYDKYLNKEYLCLLYSKDYLIDKILSNIYKNFYKNLYYLTDTKSFPQNIIKINIDRNDCSVKNSSLCIFTDYTKN